MRPMKVTNITNPNTTITESTRRTNSTSRWQMSHCAMKRWTKRRMGAMSIIRPTVHLPICAMAAG
jgi:hypothetical protein